MFADKATIYVRSGKGGDGHVSFRRELYVAAGGPDGGDGGDGGDVIVEVDKGINTLNDFRFRRKYSAGDGSEGGKRRMHGKAGEDLILKVPEGTVIKEALSGKVIIDMSGGRESYILLKGGRGGKGNMNYATPTMQIPKYAQPGRPAKELTITLELKLLADVGLIGFPNVGKSTILSQVSNAKPEVADYHFTTLNPILGVVNVPGADGFVMADIPGLIEGASEGVGLGHEFLKHIERTKLFVHVVDAASTEGRDPLNDINIINAELEKYDAGLMKKPQIIALNKCDVFIGNEEDTVISLIKEEFEPKGVPVMAVSAATGRGIKELIYKIRQMLDELHQPDLIYEQEYIPDIEADKGGINVSYDKENDEYVIEGPAIERMLGYTNLNDEKGFSFFQRYLHTSGIVDRLKELGVNEGDTVRMYGHTFEYYE
ncbi:MAG: GTPase ObgE [Lachnospiraceae bacterium]|jgi:GTP-binding protein|nr:GTPase ObgE [Lachnospiraceae bacterium]MEE3461093.1 GTPase ObgE [Lachnospiraceae bacterium]